MSRDLYLKAGDGFVMVYSITDSSSLEDVNGRYQSLLDATVRTHFISEGENRLRNYIVVFEYVEYSYLHSYIPILQGAMPETCKPVIFVGNKADLDHDRVVSKEHGKTVADELGGGRIRHLETSAKNDTNVTEVNFEGES